MRVEAAIAAGSRWIPLALLSCLLSCVLGGCALAQSKTGSASLRGVWKVTELSSRTPGAEWTRLPLTGSLYIFTDRHYSYMFAPGTEPRRPFAADPNRPSDAEKIRAYDTIVAASGTYVLSGSTLTLTAWLHKNPSEMVGESLAYEIEVDGDVLRMTIVNPPFSPGRERRTTLTRIE